MGPSNNPRPNGDQPRELKIVRSDKESGAGFSVAHFNRAHFDEVRLHPGLVTLVNDYIMAQGFDRYDPKIAGEKRIAMSDIDRAQRELKEHWDRHPEHIAERMKAAVRVDTAFNYIGSNLNGLLQVYHLQTTSPISASEVIYGLAKARMGYALEGTTAEIGVENIKTLLSHTDRLKIDATIDLGRRTRVAPLLGFLVFEGQSLTLPAGLLGKGNLYLTALHRNSALGVANNEHSICIGQQRSTGRGILSWFGPNFYRPSLYYTGQLNEEEQTRSNVQSMPSEFSLNLKGIHQQESELAVSQDRQTGRLTFKVNKGAPVYMLLANPDDGKSY